MWKTVASFQSKLSIDNAAYDGPNDLWISDVSQNHVPTKSLPSIYTTTLWNLQGKSSSPAALWTLPKGWTALGIDRVSSEDVYVYATRSLYDMTKGAAIFSTHNGGASWTEWETKAGAKALNVPVPLNLYPSGAKVDMSFPNAQDGYMLTGNGLLKTTDGGATWTYLPS